MRRGFRRRHAQVRRDVILLEHPDPLRSGLSPQHFFQFLGQRIAIGTPLCIAHKALVVQLRDQAHEVLPEVLFQDAERQALAVGGFEDIVHRKKVCARIDLAIQAVAHGAQEECRFE